MNKKAALFWLIALILLVACGGGGETEVETPSTDNDTSSSTTTETVDEEEPEEESPSTETEEEMEETTDESETADESEDATEATEEDAGEDSEETEVEEAAAEGGFGSRPMSGTDPDTGLVVNPDSVNPGDTFIVRGEIISMNLTPTTAPEFLVQSPEGLKFRIRSQDLAETFYEDGDQLQPFQYQLGILAQATATLPADAGPSDIPVSDDFTLVKGE